MYPCKTEYDAHIKSARWKNICAVVRKQADNVCQRCGEGSARLEVHHLTYERFGHERLADLKLLCQDCHKIEDEIREKATKIKSANALYKARYAGYMKTKYGEDWINDDTLDTVYEFNEWLETKKESQDDYDEN